MNVEILDDARCVVSLTRFPFQQFVGFYDELLEWRKEDFDVLGVDHVEAEAFISLLAEATGVARGRPPRKVGDWREELAIREQQQRGLSARADGPPWYTGAEVRIDDDGMYVTTLSAFQLSMLVGAFDEYLQREGEHLEHRGWRQVEAQAFINELKATIAEARRRHEADQEE